MSTLERLRAHYGAMLDDPDPIRRGAAAGCLNELAKVRERTNSTRLEADDLPDEQPAPWAHVLPELIVASGNSLIDRGGAEAKSGHEPIHSSSSGTCISINRARGVWWCSSCRRGGTAISWVMDTRNLAYSSASSWLNLRYGAPTG